MTLAIKPLTASDAMELDPILLEVVAEGETYALPRDLSSDQVLRYWFGEEHRVFGAWLDERLVGSYFLRPNQRGSGAHVANAGFVVARWARGRGLARELGEHCLGIARQSGFRAMQFNFVVSTNEAALRVWRALGFTTVGVLPQAFLHPRLGYVDAYVLFRSLV